MHDGIGLYRLLYRPIYHRSDCSSYMPIVFSFHRTPLHMHIGLLYFHFHGFAYTDIHEQTVQVTSISISIFIYFVQNSVKYRWSVNQSINQSNCFIVRPKVDQSRAGQLSMQTAALIDK